MAIELLSEAQENNTPHAAMYLAELLEQHGKLFEAKLMYRIALEEGDDVGDALRGVLKRIDRDIEK